MAKIYEDFAVFLDLDLFIRDLQDFVEDINDLDTQIKIIPLADWREVDKQFVQFMRKRFDQIAKLPLKANTIRRKRTAVAKGFEFAVNSGGGTQIAKHTEAGKRTGNLFLSITESGDILGGTKKFRKKLKSIPGELTNAELSYSINLAAFYKRYPAKFQEWLGSKDGGRGILFLEDNDISSLLNIISGAMLARVEKIMVHGKSTRTIRVFK